jgi:hypothetical protein
MTVESKLEEAFDAYLNLARAELRPQQAKPSTLVPFAVLRNRADELRQLVDELETRKEFREVVPQVVVVFRREHRE